MLKALYNNSAGLHKGPGLLIGMVLLLAGCTIINEPGFTEWDYKIKQEGYHLHCTDYRDEACVVMEWVKDGNGLNRTDSTNN